IGKSLSPSCRGRTVKQATALPVTAIGSLNGWQYFPAHSILSTKSFQTFSSQVPTAFLLGFAQKILGGHRPPLQLGVRNCRGALMSAHDVFFVQSRVKLQRGNKSENLRLRYGLFSL